MAYLCAFKVFSVFFIILIIDKCGNLSIGFLLKRAFFKGDLMV